MKINFFKNTNYLGGIIIVLAFAVLYSLYFFFYIPQQENKLQQRAFRILKEYGNNMSGKNDYYKNHFENYRLYYAIRYFKKSNQIVDNKFIPDSSTFSEIKKVIEGLYDYVDCQERTTNKPDTSLIFTDHENKSYLNYNAQLKQKTDTVWQNSIKEIGNYYQITAADTAHLSKKDSLKLFTDLFENNRLQYYVPIDKLMEGLKFDQLFENIVLFDKSRVYYNSKQEIVTDITRPDALSDSVEHHQGGIWESMKIRGKEKQMMVLPFDFLGTRFYFAGIISDIEYRSKTRTIDSQLIILAAVLLLLILIGMPILKIIFIGKNERLKSTDASASLISSVFGTGLLILMMLGIVKHKYIDHPKIEDRIIDISNKLSQNVRDDLDSIIDLYKSISFNNEIKTDSALIMEDNFKITSPYSYLFKRENRDLNFYKLGYEYLNWAIYKKYYKSSTLANFAVEKLSENDKKFHLYKEEQLNGMFPVNEIILIDQNGIISKAVTRTQFSELVPVNLSQRNYFINAKNASSSWPVNDSLRFYIESIKSYNTGEGETAISFHNFNSDEIPATAITSSIPALYNQVLPKDVEFLIIDSSGKVLYHSMKSKSLHENFLDECDFDEQLQNAINYRTESTFHIDYNEKKWMVRIIPIANTPLFHITLIDMSQNNNKNARIFLFTFYFLIILLIAILIGMLILRWGSSSNATGVRREWFLDWILFRPENYPTYFILAVIMFILIIVQLFGIRASNKPTSILIYQVIFVSYSSFVSLVLLKRQNLVLKHLLKKEFFPESLVLLIVLILTILLLFTLHYVIGPILSIAVLVLLTVKLPTILMRLQTTKINKKISSENKKRIYLLFLLFWLVSLSGIPVIQFYRSVKYQEDQIEKQEQLFTVAKRNLLLYDDFYRFRNTPWLKAIQGNGLDHLKVEFREPKSDAIPHLADTKEERTISDFLYASLPDPVTNNLDKSVFVNDLNYKDREWIKNDTTLIYSKHGSHGVVSVTSDPSFKPKTYWNFTYLVIAVFIGILLWIILKYVASEILNIRLENPKIIKSDWIKSLFKESSSQQFLLQSYNPDYYLKVTNEFAEENKAFKIVFLKAWELSDEKYIIPTVYFNSDYLLWISGLDQLVYEIDKHELFLSRIFEISKLSSAKIVIELPFSFDFIDEVYKEFLSENKAEKDSTVQIDSLKKKWNLTFRNYIEFNGFYPKDENKESQKSHLSSPATTDLQCDYIWNNLTNHEKVVLFDLADDGLVNIKNKLIINRLIQKNLISLEPTPKFNSSNLRNYILKNLSKETVKMLEGKLGFKKKWKSMRYLILFILIPLAAFIMISQGISIEKIFGIFTGILAVITTVARLFDSQLFKHSAS